MGRRAREMEQRANELEKRLNESQVEFDSEKAKLIADLHRSEEEKKGALESVRELETKLVRVEGDCERLAADAARSETHEGEEKGERDSEIEALRRRVDELTGSAAQIMRLESVVRDQRQTLRSQESELQNLIEENTRLQVGIACLKHRTGL